MKACQLDYIFNPHRLIQLEEILFTTANVTAAIRKLKSNLSSGSDGLPPLLFKRCCESLAQPLAIMFTQFLSVSYVPDDWKTAIIVPVYKKKPNY